MYLACRSKEKTLASIARLEEEVPSAKEAGQLRFLQVDMSDMRSVKKAAEEFLSKEDALHTLFNNACVSPVSLCVWEMVRDYLRAPH